jgi:hypothetical protein
MRGSQALTTTIAVMTVIATATMTATEMGEGTGQLAASVKPSGIASLGTLSAATATRIGIGKESGATGTAPATAMRVGAVAG